MKELNEKLYDEKLVKLIVEAIHTRDKDGLSKKIMKEVKREMTVFSKHLSKLIETLEDYKPGIFSGIITRATDHYGQEDIRKELNKMLKYKGEDNLLDMYKSEIITLFGHIISHTNARGIKIRNKKIRRRALNMINEYLKSSGYHTLSYKQYEREPDYIWHKIKNG